MKDRTLALAGVFQATELVRQAANHGTWSGYAATSCLYSLFELEADSLDDGAGVEILAKDNTHLVQVGGGPDLGIPETEAVFLRAAHRLQHGVLVVDDQFLEAGILHPNIVLQTTVVEYRPGEARSDGVAEAVTIEQVAHVTGVGVAGGVAE